eukprot:scaffold11.g3920.t1
MQSEAGILAALDSACATAFGGHADKRAACDGLLSEHRQELEEHVFHRGVRDLGTFLCVVRAPLCDPHTLIDTGEL